MKIPGAEDRSSSGYPLNWPPREEPKVPNPNANDQSSSGYPYFWPEYIFLTPAPKGTTKETSK